jgi:hypothetical protein
MLEMPRKRAHYQLHPETKSTAKLHHKNTTSQELLKKSGSEKLAKQNSFTA